jgi:hypothetical protein
MSAASWYLLQVYGHFQSKIVNKCRKIAFFFLTKILILTDVIVDALTVVYNLLELKKLNFFTISNAGR